MGVEPLVFLGLFYFLWGLSQGQIWANVIVLALAL